jgi:DNA-binding GntR family transcriptional regulator
MPAAPAPLALAPRPLERVELNEQVYETVRQWLVGSRLEPGQRLSINQIATAVGVSRSPVHHALTRLVGEGLVSVEPRRGYFVTPVTVPLVVQAYDVRQALELHAAEVSVGRIGADALAGLRGLMERTLATLDGRRFRDRRAYIRTNQAFHQRQVDLAANPLLSSAYAGLPVNLLMERILGPSDVDAGAIAGEHVRLVEAFEQGDLRAVQRAVRAHVETGKRLAIDAIETAGGRL